MRRRQRLLLLSQCTKDSGLFSTPLPPMRLKTPNLRMLQPQVGSVKNSRILHESQQIENTVVFVQKSGAKQSAFVVGHPPQLGPLRVTVRRTSDEYIFSGMHPIVAGSVSCRRLRSAPKQKSRHSPVCKRMTGVNLKRPGRLRFARAIVRATYPP